MKTLRIAAFILAGAALGSAAKAQTWDLDQGQLNLVECYGGQDGVYCDFTYTLTKSQTQNADFHPNYFKFYKLDGTAQIADKISLTGKEFVDSYVFADIIYGTPIKVTWYLNIPAVTPSLRAIEINGQRIENVVIRPPKGAKPPVATTLPSAPSVTGFSVTLSNCRLNSNVYTCTATLTPTK
ncbi:hypothetical protein MF271_09270 [Deinococcus sp. KNUC1210]|uniref:hypothetical protein n=1 Tax=Deinococcus sp. KNUC1210 TaxID=2917691 RepID=UPI001EEFB866|nr:hypothetical protein [Deinococcus sp. KNUC1210]ULH16740.1 hypothetical protein MF271_09270 [Deinococcus sp. KNUC1210]